jgi:hypothetical protein
MARISKKFTESDYPQSIQTNEGEAKIVPGTVGAYATSNGEAYRVRLSARSYNFGEAKISRCPQWVDVYGYARVNVKRVDGANTNMGAHRMVISAWRGASDLPVNHIDFNRLNNSVTNLEYVTHKENTHHSLAAGRIFSGNMIMDEFKLLTIYTLANHSPARTIAKSMGLPSGPVTLARNGKSFSDFFKRFSPMDAGTNWNKLFCGGGNHGRRKGLII